MMAFYPRLLAVLLLLCGFAACKKDTVTAPAYDFSGYTPTDEVGNITGTPDSTDWTHDSIWSSLESRQVAFTDTTPGSDTVTGYIEISPAFPNPCTGILALGVNPQYACKMKLAVVNSEFEILYYHSRLLTGGPIITVHQLGDNSAFKPGNNYRMYYAFYNATDSVYYKGHGDIRYE